jgi:tetratricopeptide (TPR) repeat protein
MTSGRFWGVFWIDMASRDTVEASFRDIAETLGVAEKSSKAVKQHLSMCEDKWLLIFDNADDPKLEIFHYLPSGNRGTIIITTRNPDNGAYGTNHKANHEVGDMPEEDAVKLLLKAARMEPETSDKTLSDDATTIVRELGCLALAIDQAGSYIVKRKCNLKHYLTDFKQNRGRLLEGPDSTPKASTYQWTAYTTWNMSFEAIKVESPLASALLLHFSFMHYEKIPVELFRRASDSLNDSPQAMANSMVLEPVLGSLLGRIDLHWDDHQFENAISTLCSFSLIKRDTIDDKSVYSTHPLVHSWTRERLVQEKLQIKLSVGSLLGHSITSTFGDSSDDHAFRSRLFVHVESCTRFSPELQMESQGKYHVIMERFSTVYREVGSYNTAARLLKGVLEAQKRALGPEHPDTLASMDNLASTYWNQGKWNEAEALGVEVLEARKRVLGSEHPDTLRSMNNLASTYGNQGKLNEAEALEVEVLEARKRVLGPEHPDTLRSMNNLASTYWDQGKLNEAEALNVEVLEARKRVLGPEHPDTLTTMSNLASTYGNQGKLNEEEALEVEVLEAQRRVLGPEHPDTLRSMNNLALTYHSLGRKDEALELMVSLVPTVSKVLGGTHPFTLDATNYLHQLLHETQSPGSI